MKIKITKRFENVYINRFSGKTKEQQRAKAEPYFRKHSLASDWMNNMREIQGNWVKVNTKFIFENSFNVGELDSSTSLGSEYVTEIDFSPEFKNVDEFLMKIQKKYDRDWPERRVSRILSKKIKNNTIKDKTPK